MTSVLRAAQTRENVLNSQGCQTIFGGARGPLPATINIDAPGLARANKTRSADLFDGGRIVSGEGSAKPTNCVAEQIGQKNDPSGAEPFSGN